MQRPSRQHDHLARFPCSQARPRCGRGPFASRHQHRAAAHVTSDRLGAIYAIDVNGRPTIAFEAKSFREARELCKEQWLRGDLGALTSNGFPLCSVDAKLTVRRATEDERRIYEEAEQSVQASDDLVLAYLVELDGPDLSQK